MTKLSAYLSGLSRFGIKPGLERIEALLKRVGNPHLQYPHLLVGGTNGKGSTCEFTARLLAQGNRKVGLYTSPHLYEWNERIRILPGKAVWSDTSLFAGAITDEELDALFDDALPHIEAVVAEMGQPTEFEVVTFLGLWHFARQNVDAAVLEVGLGGKWDATNVTDPLVSVVTHVALDHMDRLGDTLEAIAADKVCIARPNRPFLTLESKPNVLEVFKSHCEEIGAELRALEPTKTNFQMQNMLLAREAHGVFSRLLGWESQMPHFGLGAFPKVPGRAEVIAENPRTIIDGANNPDGAQIVVEHISETLKISRETLVLVLGILADKDWQQMTELLTPLARTVICTASDSPRALPAETLAEEARKYSPNVEVVTGVANAVARARELTAASDTILVTGSFTTIAEVPR